MLPSDMLVCPPSSRLYYRRTFFAYPLRAGGQVIKTLIDSFRYPRRGPGMMWEACAARIREMGGRVIMGHKVTRCAWDEEQQTWRITTQDASGRERELCAQHVISSAPLR